MIKLEGSESTGVFDLALGLPLHPLVVHAAVILIPMAALAAIAAAIRPAISRKYGAVIIGIAVIGQLSSFLAKATGQEFVERLGIDIERHVSFGENAPLTSLPLLALVVLLYRVDKKRSSKGQRKIIATLTVLAAIFAAGYMALTGHSGAEAVWSWVKFN
jgi:hypothetical protein